MSDDVGYRKPPMQSQFQKGKSGNPKGRPRTPDSKLKGLLVHFEREAREQVPIQENGRRRRITKVEAIVKQLINKAASGDMNAIRLVLKCLESMQQEIQKQLLEDTRPVERLSDKELDLIIQGDLIPLFEEWKRKGK